jgi:predicted AAA+ superfamily ATPase
VFNGENDMEKLIYILKEWFEYKLPDMVVRDFPYSWLNSNMVISLVGVRRSGKTYLLYQIINELRKKVPFTNILYINFEDDRLYPLTGDELKVLLDVYKQNFNYDTSKPLYLMLDEVQNIPLWQSTVRRLFDREKNIKIILTGSSSSLSSSEISSSLRGRTLTYYVFPFSFKELLKVRNISLEDKNIKYSSKKNDIVKCLKEYLMFGGFPQVVLEENKREILKEYYRSILYRDIIERYSIKNLRLFENLLKIVAQSFSSLFSYGKTLSLLKSIGFKVSKNTLIEYMKYIENSFFAFEVPIFSYSIKDRLQYPRKIYVIDTGLTNAVTFKFSEDFGRIAENVVFLELKRREKDIYYWKDKNNLEVDFLIKEGLKIKELIQVCWNISYGETKKREIKSLIKAMDEFKIDTATVITEDYDNIEKVNGKKIVYLTLWQWLIANNE